MTKTMKLSSESTDRLQIDVSPNIKTGKIVFGDFMPMPRPSPGMVDPDDLMAELLQDPAFAAKVPHARKWLAETYFPDEKSLKTIRLKKGMSQKQLAEMINSEQPYIAKLEAGRGNPTVQTVEKIAEALAVDAVEIFEVLRSNP